MSTAASDRGLYSLDLEMQEEGGLSGSWEHDLQAWMNILLNARVG